MILVTNLKLPLSTDFSNLKNEIKKAPELKGLNILSATLFKKSVDARKKTDIHFCCSVLISVEGKEEKIVKRLKSAQIYKPKEYKFATGKVSKSRPVVVGFGPAGMFAAYTLAIAGLKPIVLERGKAVDERLIDVENFWKGKDLNTESNVQFGEGGAGTFSDGKLTTGIKDIRCSAVLKVFVENGAKKEILTDAKPHIGTDILINVVKNIRNRIIQLGGEIRFSSKLVGIELNEGNLSSLKVLSEGKEYFLPCQDVILAIGHSARDTFGMLKDMGIEMIRKPFAVGVRIEHKQSDINKALYGEFYDSPYLKAADYKLATHFENGRGVYTFCMCPGGVVVNASSEDEMTAVNGMSYSSRDGENANSAVLTEVNPSDLEGEDILAGVEFQRQIESKAYNLTSGKGVPVQTLGSYLKGKECVPNVTPSVLPKPVFCDISTIFPEFINDSLRKGIMEFDKKIKGFADDGVVITAPESRSSSPIRILRGEDLNSVTIKGIYPCGEGAGYAGGIMSAAVDGIKCAEAVTQKA
ncbi:MAG: hypothetical protein IKK77_05515 [Clostridia bacterium]|nr:hypothetical protein [Clostridia bacterium]